MHDAGFEHDHEDLYARSTEADGPERIVLTSVGIDIGSSTTHLLFSRLVLRREARGAASFFRVAERDLLWSSPILLTPYANATRIDFEAVLDFIGRCYQESGLTPDAIDSGVVVITGEALKKDNARAVADYVASQAGRFICASAGPHHEALLAAHGSGAVRLSRIGRSTVLNVDIGGGTTKLSLIRDGEIVETAAIAIGARLLAFDAGGTLIRVEEAGARIAATAGIAVAPGTRLTPAQRATIAGQMAHILATLLEGGSDPLAESLLITAPPTVRLADIDHLVFSGGVSEFLRGAADIAPGDLGPELAAGLAKTIACWPEGLVQEPAEGIRATVIGASAYTLQVSGLTGFSSAGLDLPLQALKVVPVRREDGASFAVALAGALRKFDRAALDGGMMLSIAIDSDIEYPILREIAEAIAAAATKNAPLIINMEQDVARALGRILTVELGLANPLLAIDGIMVGELDFVDIGAPVGTGIFPVTVRSLLFAPPASG